jgi:hypothetical protein
VVTKKYDILADASGELDFTVLPCLITSIVSTRGNISGGTAWAVANTATSAGYKPAVSAPVATGDGFDTGGLYAQYSKYRIAAMGARVRGNAGVSATGEMTAAVHPLKGLAPGTVITPGVFDVVGPNLLSTPNYTGTSGPRSYVENYLRALGLPYSGTLNTAKLDIPKLVAMPCHAVATASEVSARGLHCRSVPFEASAREFRNTQYEAVGTDAVDTVSSVDGTAVQNYSMDMSAFKIGGFESIILGGSGFTVSTRALSLEIIYHLEVIVNPQLATLARPTSSIPRSIGPSVLDQQLASLHRLARISFADIVKQVGDSFLGDLEGRAVKSAGALGLGSVGGVLARLIQAAV